MRIFKTGAHVTPDVIENGKTFIDTVIVELPYVHDEIESGAITLVGDFGYERDVPRYGKVVAVPQKVTDERYSWLPNMELEKGDTVWFKFMASAIAVGLSESKGGSNMGMWCDGKYYLVIDYHSCSLAKRGNTFIPLNGYVFCTPVEKTGEIEYVETEFPDIWKVKMVGKPNLSWKHKIYEDYGKAEQGMTVIVEKGRNVPLETEGRAILEKLYYCHRHEVHGYIS